MILSVFSRPVAQLAEHLTLNHGVEGSIPSGPTKEVGHKEDPAGLKEDLALILERKK